MLLHLVDGTSDTFLEDYKTIVGELEAYGGELAQKPRITVLNKVDALDEEERDYFNSELERVSGGSVLLMSGVSREGTDTVLRALRAQIDDTRLRVKKSIEEPLKWNCRGKTACGEKMDLRFGGSLHGQIAPRLLKTLVAAALKAAGKDVVLVSSGSIALGRGVLVLPRTSLPLEQSQAAAAVGQIQLARAYEEVLAPHGITTAQILVTLEDSADRRRYLNSRATMETLLSMGAVPIVNENDTVATDEIRYGDNDRLAAQVAVTVGADALVLLSDVDGFYSANPNVDATAQRFDVIDVITPEIEAMAGDAGSGLSKGGMKTKLMAAKTATAAGCAMVIT